MNKSLIITVVAAVLVVASWVGAYAWVSNERRASLERLNRLDYATVHESDVSDYLQEDVGLSLDELRDTAPADTGLRSFPELYLVARAMNSAGQTGVALQYYAEAETRLEDYHNKDALTPEFYLAYASTMTDEEETKALAERATEIINSIGSLTDSEKDYYSQVLQIYATGEIAPEEEE